MAKLPTAKLFEINPLIAYNSGTFLGLNSPLTDNAYLIFRKSGEPNIIKKVIKVRENRSDGTRLDDQFVSSIKLDKFGKIGTNVIEGSITTGEIAFRYYFYPFDEDGNPELYDVYIIANKNKNFFSETQLDSYIPQDGVNYYVDKFIDMPTLKYTLVANDSQDERISNLINDGQFSNTYLNLPPTNQFASGVIRDPITQINENISYEVSLNQNYPSTLFADKLTINSFIGDPGLEASPKNYLRIQATNTNPALPWLYRDIAFYFEPYFKFNNRSFTLSFCAVNNNLDLTTILPIGIGYERNYGPTAMVEPRATFADVPTQQVTNLWQKFSVTIDLEENTDFVQSGTPTYIKILLRLPVILNSFDLSITNIYLDYGSSAVSYPVDYEPTYPKTLDNFGKSIVNTTNGYIPLSSRAGEIKQFLYSQDTENTILADGRVIYPDDIHYYNMNGVLFRIPFSNTYKTGLYDIIGYQYGTGDDHFTCDSLHNSTWQGDVLNENSVKLYDNIFYWNYAAFKPNSNFTTGLGNGTVIQAIELYSGQNRPPQLALNAFFEQNNNFKIWYANDQSNYITQAANNGANTSIFQSTDAIGFQVDTNGNTVTEIYYDADPIITDSTLTPSITGLSLLRSKICPIKSTNPINNNTSPNFPNKKIDRTNVAGNFGNIDVNFVDSTESPIYIVNSEYYNTFGTTFKAEIKNGLTLIAKFAPYNRIVYNPNNIPSDPAVALNRSRSFTYSVVKITSSSETPPTTNPDFNIQPLQPTGSIPGSTYILNTTVIPTYYSDSNYDWLTPQGTNNSVKKIRLFLITEGKCGFGLKLISQNPADYYGLWFYAESNATRTIRTASYVNNVPTITTTTVDDNKFCFYFSNGSTPTPTDPSIPANTKFIPILLTGISIGTTAPQMISQQIEKTINSYRVQIPNLQGMVLQGYGNSMFQNSQNNDNKPIVMCKNFRNNGFSSPKMIEYTKNSFINVDEISGNSANDYAPVYETIKNSMDIAYVYNHISVN